MGGESVEAGVTRFLQNITSQILGEGRGDASVNIDDIRWEGMSNAQLATAVAQLQTGPGAAAITHAADALAAIAADLAQLDQTLRTQLSAIGVNWQSQEASELAQEMTTAAAAYGGSVADQGGQAANSMNDQGDAYSAAKNSAPAPNVLSGPTQTNGMDHLVQTLTGHGTDHSAQVAQTQTARTTAVDTMNNYTSASQASLASCQGLSQPPTIGLRAQSYGGAPTAPVTAPSMPGVPAAPAVGSPGATGPLAGVGGGPGMPAGPGGGSGPVTPTPGPISGVSGPPGAISSSAPPVVPTAGSSAFAEDAAIGAAIVGGSAAAGVAGSAAMRDKLVRTRQANQFEAFADDEDEDLLAPDAATVQRAAEAEQAAASPILTSPVGGQSGESDREHGSRYATDEDLFGDGRMVVPGVLGVEDEGA